MMDISNEIRRLKMSHGLMNYDWMLSTKERPWHGIGTVVQDAPTSDEAIKIAKLDWEVKQYPVVANGKEIPNMYANVREDTNECLGVVKSRYRIYQNTESFKFVDEIVGNKEIPCTYETCGSLFNGRRVFMLVKLPNQLLVGDDVENYLFFTNSHDGSSAFLAGMTNVRVVCNNTLQMAVKGAQRVWRCRHTDSLTGRVQQAKESLGLAMKYMSSIQDVAEDMASKKVTIDSFIKTLEKSNPLHSSDKMMDKVTEHILTIYNEKDDLQNFKGTAWGIYNAVADYVSNSVPFRNTKKAEQNRLVSVFDGNALLEASQRILMVA